MAVMRRPKPLDGHLLRPRCCIDHIPVVPERHIASKSPYEGKCHNRHHRPNPPNDPRYYAVESTINHCPSVHDRRAFYFTVLALNLVHGYLTDLLKQTLTSLIRARKGSRSCAAARSKSQCV